MVPRRATNCHQERVPAVRALAGNAANVIGVGLDGYNGFRYDLPGAKIGASLGAGALITVVVVGGPVAAGVGLLCGLAGLYANASVPLISR